MKATGIVRRMDDLGRVVIPKELRKFYGIREGDALEIYTTAEGIVFAPYRAPAANKAMIAQKWLEDNRQYIASKRAKFDICGGTVRCEVIENNSRCGGEANTNPRDTFIPAVGMVIAFNRAIGAHRNIPSELLEDD